MPLMPHLAAVLLLLASSLAAAEHPPSPPQAELDRLLAPVALYPDSVLAQVLEAATYPLAVVRAARWSRAHPGLAGQAAVTAAQAEGWPPSVTALVAFPDLLARMNEDLEWTEQLGAAYAAAPDQVLATVQDLREHAWASGHLRSSEHVRVVRHTHTIIIEPAYHHRIHLPYYDTYVVYGDWWWPSHPPVWWACPAGYYPHSGFWWSRGIRYVPSHRHHRFHWTEHHAFDRHRHDRHRGRHERPRHRGWADRVRSHRPDHRPDRHRDAPSPDRPDRHHAAPPAGSDRPMRPANKPPARQVVREQRPRHEERGHGWAAAAARREEPAAHSEQPRPRQKHGARKSRGRSLRDYR